MTTYVESAEVNGFWGDHRVQIPMHSDVNFLIGVNGSGKTTLINLLAAALTADFEMLENLIFDSIRIKLHRKSPYAKPVIYIEKQFEEEHMVSKITYKIQHKSSGVPSVHTLRQDMPTRRYYYTKSGAHMKYRARNRFSEAITPLQEELSELCNVSWITIHRHRGPLESERTREYESTVDKKLSTISSQLSQYFASLQKRVSEETEKFQERVFLSLLYEEKQEALLSTVRELDIASERDALGEIFRELRVKDKTFQPKLKKHFDHLNRSLKKFDEENRLELDDLFVIINMWRIHSIVSDWHDLTKEKEHIFSPRDTFLSVLNEMMNRKQIDIDDANELYATTQSGKEFPVYELSSGEKQIVILLGECLLQRNENWIYIADEPELSLHVAWQRQLVSNLKRLNENAQVIFATHSPDIVGPYSDRVHHMEESIS